MNYFFEYFGQSNATYIFILFLLSVVFSFIIFLFFNLKFLIFKSIQTDNQYPVSVIICARNEEDNLRKRLVFVLDQDYPEFEVIVVNDNSSDNTELYLKELKEEYPNLQIVNSNVEDPFAKGKKFPLTLGIKRAKYEHLLLTDADCLPTGRLWIQSMQKNFSDSKQIVLGYGPYEKTQGLINHIIRVDTFLIAYRYFSFALAGMPYMGVGRNLAYKKELFINNKGFASHYHVASGDDDLFISEVANSKNTIIETSKESLMYSKSKKTLQEFLRQKRRHLTTSPHYKFKFKILLGITPLNDLLHYSSFIVLLIMTFQIKILFIVFLVRYLLKYFSLLIARKKLNEKGLLLFLYPFYDIFYIFFSILVVYLNKRYRTGTWR